MMRCCQFSFFFPTFAPACILYKGNTKTALWHNLCTWNVTLCFGSWFHALDSDWLSCAHQQAKRVFWRFGECWPTHLGHVRSRVNPSDAHLLGTCSICVHVQHHNGTSPLLSCSTLSPYALFSSLNVDVGECALQSESVQTSHKHPLQSECWPSWFSKDVKACVLRIGLLQQMHICKVEWGQL